MIPPITTVDRKFSNKLIAACASGNTEKAVRLVMALGAEVVSSTAHILVAPLHTAASKGQTGTVRALVTRLGAAVDVASSTGMTALHYAAAEGATETVRVLLEELGATVNARDISGWTPFFMAARRYHFETVLLLARLGADISCVVTVGIGSGDDRGSSNGGANEMIGVGVNERRQMPTALHSAALYGRMDVISTLIRDFGADVNTVDETEGATPLHYAARAGESEAVVSLIREFGADVEAKALDGRTPLHMALNYCETARILIDPFGASLAARSGDGLAPIHKAAKGHSSEAVRILLTRGACVSAPAASGWTPLHFAARHGPAAVVEALLDHGADPEATDGYEDEPHTAAFFAAMSGDEGVCKVLAEALACDD